MKKSDLGKIIKEVLDEMSVTGGGASFSPGSGEQYATPKAFAKKGQKTNAAIKTAEKFGYTRVERPKHPSHTKLVDYLEEHGGGHYVTPNAFTSEYDLYNQDAVKYSENIGMEVVDKPENLSKETLENYSDSH